MARRKPASWSEEEQAAPLVDRAYEHIKARILGLGYRPGEALSEPKVAEELGISRTPVREAVRRLMAEGLVTWTPGKGKAVYTLRLQDLDEIFDVKQALQAMVASAAATNRTEGEARELELIAGRLSAACEAGNTAAWSEAEGAYHALLFRSAALPRVQRIIANVDEQWERLRVGLLPLQMAVSVKGYQQVASLVVAGDGKGASAAMGQHINRLRETVTALVRNLLIPYVGENL